MSSDTDTTGRPIEPGKDLGEGAEDFRDQEDRPGIGGIPDDDEDAANDLLDDAELAAAQILEKDEGQEEIGAPTPSEVAGSDLDEEIAEIPEPGEGDESGEI